MSFNPNAKRYDDAMFRRSGRSGSSCLRFRWGCGKILEASMSSKRAGQSFGELSIEA